MATKKGKVLLAMSGGVDSSVAAVLLQEQGYEVIGAFMRLGSPGEELEDGAACDPTKVKIGKQGCCSINDAKDAQFIAAMLDIPFYVLNFKQDFGRIINYFVGEYNAGRTPNPCVRCNDWLKFGKLAQYAASMDCDYVASGHYARVEKRGSEWQLLRGIDESKDQSYVLFGAPRHNLDHMMLPIGGYDKSEIRQIAEEHKLPVFNKPDSQEICFVPDNDYFGLVSRKSPDTIQPGKIVDTSGKEVGDHDGHQKFTIGQRRGVGVAFGYPIYVVDKDPVANTVTVGAREDLSSEGLIADQVNWLVDPPNDWLPCRVKIRYNASLVDAEVKSTGEDELQVRFTQDQDAVAPGQAVVAYDEDRVLGGAWIQEAY